MRSAKLPAAQSVCKVYRHTIMNSEEFKKQLLPIHNKLYRLSVRILANLTDAEDVVQEAYLKLWNLREKLGDIDNPKAFAVTVTKNLSLDRLKQRRTLSMNDSSQYLFLTDSINPFEQIEHTEDVVSVKTIINRLPDQQKSIIVLRDLEGLSFEEIQDVTGLSINTIRVNLSRARKVVRDQLIKFHNYGTERNKKTSGQIL